MSQRQSDEAHETEMMFSYANNVSIAVGVYDVQLEFAVEIDQKRVSAARIAMSPQHAKSLQLLLERILADYEQTVGPISLPEELETRLRKGPPIEEKQDIPS